MPSIDDASVALLPDGRMQVTWTLREGVTWHDGAPFTADDAVFSWDVMRDPEASASTATAVVNLVQNVESVRAAGPYTAVITWKTPNYRALDMGFRQYWIIPRHLLSEAFQGDKQAFTAQPFFTTQYIHLGPFRLVDFQAGEQQVFRRFDNYFLGRPKVDTIVIRTVRDPNALFASMKAGTVDVVGERTLTGELFMQLREEWAQTGEGTVVDRQYNWRVLLPQHGPQWARPIELAQDVRVRRGLLRAIDRDAFGQLLYRGFGDTNADSFMLASDPSAPTVGKPFAPYGYDVARGQTELAAAGWERASDGRLLGRDNRQVQIEVRGARTDGPSVSLVADFWRRIGIDVSELLYSGPTSDDPEFRGTFPGVENTARSDIFPIFDGRLHALPENRWSAANKMHYANPALDRLIDRIYRTIDQRESALLLKEVGEIFTEEVPVLPLYYVMEFAAARKGVRAILDDFPNTGYVNASPGASARSAHLWEVE